MKFSTSLLAAISLSLATFAVEAREVITERDLLPALGSSGHQQQEGSFHHASDSLSKRQRNHTGGRRHRHGGRIRTRTRGRATTAAAAAATTSTDAAQASTSDAVVTPGATTSADAAQASTSDAVPTAAPTTSADAAQAFTSAVAETNAGATGNLQTGNNAATDVGGNQKGGNNNAGADNSDPQKSLTLDPSQVQTGLALDGQQIPANNQVASATSTNNFINFCLTRSDLPLTNGAQVKTGSCNNVPIGVIAAQSVMPSSKFQNPKNLDTIAADTTFTIEMKINNLVTGNFVNAQANYFAAPQNTDNSGTIIGHSHVVIEAIDSLTSTTVTNPQQFAFFKGFNAAANNGVLSAEVAGGLPAGTYRMSSINAAANHQPVIVAVAQHGSLDDAVYFTVTAGGVAANNSGNNQNAADSNAGNNTNGGNQNAADPNAADSNAGNQNGGNQNGGQNNAVNQGNAAVPSSTAADAASTAAADAASSTDAPAASSTDAASSSTDAASSTASAAAATESATAPAAEFTGAVSGANLAVTPPANQKRCDPATLLRKRLAALEVSEGVKLL